MNFGTSIGLIIVLICLYVLWEIRELLLLVFTAVVIATALNILVKRFKNWGIKRSYGVLLSILLLLISLGSFFWTIVPPLADQFQELVKLVPEGIELLILYINDLETMLSPEFTESMPSINELAQQLQPLMNELLGGGLNFFYSSLGVVLSLLLLLALTMMILGDPTPYRQGFIRLFPSFYRLRVDSVLMICEQKLQKWIIESFVHMIVMIFFSFIILLILGIPLALVQAMLTGILSFIPTIGSGLSVISPMAIALTEEPWKSLVVLVLYLIIQGVSKNMITPLIISDKVLKLPAISLLAQVFFASFFGIGGLFLAVPLIIIGQILVQEILIKDILNKWKTEKKIKDQIISKK